MPGCPQGSFLGGQEQGQGGTGKGLGVEGGGLGVVSQLCAGKPPVGPCL